MKVVSRPGATRTLYRVINDTARPKEGEKVVMGGMSPDEAKKLVDDLRSVEWVLRS